MWAVSRAFHGIGNVGYPIDMGFSRIDPNAAAFEEDKPKWRSKLGFPFWPPESPDYR